MRKIDVFTNLFEPIERGLVDGVLVDQIAEHRNLAIRDESTRTLRVVKVVESIGERERGTFIEGHILA